MKKFLLCFLFLALIFGSSNLRADGMGDVHITGINVVSHTGHYHLYPVYTIARTGVNNGCEDNVGFLTRIKQIRNGVTIALYFTANQSVWFTEDQNAIATCTAGTCPTAGNSCWLEINSRASSGTVVDHGLCANSNHLCLCEVTDYAEDSTVEGVEISTANIQSGDIFVAYVQPDEAGAENFFDTVMANNSYSFVWP